MREQGQSGAPFGGRTQQQQQPPPGVGGGGEGGRTGRGGEGFTGIDDGGDTASLRERVLQLSSQLLASQVSSRPTEAGVRRRLP